MGGFYPASNRVLYLPLPEAAERTFYNVSGTLVPSSEIRREQVLLTLRGGSQLRSLTVQAADLHEAVTVLRTIKAWFVVRDNSSLPARYARSERAAFR